MVPSEAAGAMAVAVNGDCACDGQLPSTHMIPTHSKLGSFKSRLLKSFTSQDSLIVCDESSELS